MSIQVDVQFAAQAAHFPTRHKLEGWVKAALAGRREKADLTVRIVDAAEGAELNQRWRHKPGPTNVLSFPANGVEEIAPELLGDIVICAPVVLREAEEQGKDTEAHWAHLVVHGALHLLGFDHLKEPEARAMEQLETEILIRLGYSDPYISH